MKIRPVYKCRNCLVRFTLDPIEINNCDLTDKDIVDRLISSFDNQLNDEKSLLKLDNENIRMLVSHKCNAISIGFADIFGVELC